MTIMKIKVLLCNCKGLCGSFKDNDFNTLPFQIESEVDVAYVSLHPQTCGQGGNEFLSDILRNADEETYVLSGACAPEAQEKLFKKVFRKTGFPPERFIPVDIRMTDNDGVLERIRQKVDELVCAGSVATGGGDGDPLPSCLCSQAEEVE
jgi:heterodisulfide reductase subunit A-like polyferredoxin